MHDWTSVKMIRNPGESSDVREEVLRWAQDSAEIRRYVVYGELREVGRELLVGELRVISHTSEFFRRMWTYAALVLMFELRVALLAQLDAVGSVQ